MGHYCKAHLNDALYCYLCTDLYPIKDMDTLLAVARAAYAYDYCMDEERERKERLLRNMRKALAAVEDLL